MTEQMAGRRKLRAVIAGGGLAGMCCAKRLIDAGFEVELVEAEPQFGGRTANWTDPDGQQVESGVHTFFGVYDHLIQLLNEVGVDDDRMVTWDDKVGFLRPGARLNIFATDPIRDLLGVLGRVIGNNNFINPGEKLSLGFTFLSGLVRRDQYEPYTIRQLARDGGVDRQTYERVFRPLARGLHFCEPEELSAYALLTLASHGVMNPWNIRAGTWVGGMTDVMINPIARWLEARSARLRTNAPVESIRYANGRITGFVLRGGEVLTGDVYVSALPLEVFQPMLPRELLNLRYFQRIAELETVPALAVQLWYDRRFVHRTEYIFLAGSSMTVFQDESHETFPYPGSRISAQMTDRKIDGLDDDQLIALAVREINHYIPASRAATLQKAVVVRHAAIAMKPGAQRRRPVQGSPVQNFFLAGDYTKQDWFTTMEGACRSGEMAAAAIKRRTGIMIEDDDFGAIPPGPYATRDIAPAIN